MIKFNSYKLIIPSVKYIYKNKVFTHIDKSREPNSNSYVVTSDILKNTINGFEHCHYEGQLLDYKTYEFIVSIHKGHKYINRVINMIVDTINKKEEFYGSYQSPWMFDLEIPLI